MLVLYSTNSSLSSEAPKLIAKWKLKVQKLLDKGVSLFIFKHYLSISQVAHRRDGQGGSLSEDTTAVSTGREL